MSATKPPRRAVLPGLLALFVPLLMFSWGWARLQRPAEVTDKAAGMERKLKAQKPLVLVIGSSLARTNVDSELLAEELGVSRKNVTLLTLPNATAAHWYAIMKNRVFENGHRPKAVVFVGALTTMITPEVLMDSSVERLVNQLSDNEPVIGRKVFGTTDPRDFRYLYMREQAGQLRDDLLSSYRDWALGWLCGNGKAEVGRRCAERANEVVFADDKMDYTLHARESTGLYVGAVEEIDVTGVDVERESLIPDIAALARQYGSYAVFVRTPFPPSNNDNDLVPPELEERTRKVMEASESVYLDLRSLNLDDSYFQDMRHMSPQGAAIFTKALARAIDAMGVLDKKRDVDVDIQLSLQPTKVERLGTPPSLADLLASAEPDGPCAWRIPPGPLAGLDVPSMARAGQARAMPVRVTTRKGEAVPWMMEPRPGCNPAATFDASGLRVAPGKGLELDKVALSLEAEVPFTVEGEELPAWWVYPGTRLRFEFDEPWPHDDEAFKVFLLGHAFGGLDGRARVEVAGQSSLVERLENRAWLAASPPAPRDGRWALEVVSPEDGPWLLVQNLAIGAMPRTTHLVGLPELLNGASIRLVGGKVEDTELDPVFSAPPPKLNTTVRVRKAPRGLGMIALPAFAPLADAPTSRASVPHKCSPFVLYEDGAPLADRHATCLDVANLKAGRSCHAGNVIYFSASDSSPPYANNHKYTMALDETRVCDRRNQRNTTPLRGVLWLYPGDHLVLSFPEEKLLEFYDGANRLELEVETPIIREGDVLDVRLYVDDQVFMEDRVEPPASRRAVKVYPFEPPIPPRTRNVRLEVKNSSTRSYWLLLMATLSEDYDYGFTPTRLVEEVEEELGGTDDDMFGISGEDPFGELEEEEAGRVQGPSRASRVGQVPVLPPMKEPKRLKDGMVEGHLFSLWPVSNSVLAKRGLEWWSPVRVYEGATPLEPAASRKEFKEDCTGCFLHLGQAIITQPSDPMNLEALRVELAAEVPVPTVSGRDIWWVYPGTGVRLEFDEPWAGDALSFHAEIDTFTQEKAEVEVMPTLRVQDLTASFEANERGYDAVVEVRGKGRGPWYAEIESPVGGPFVLIFGAEYRDARGRTTVIARPRAVTPAEEVWDEGAP